jgi:hypothetical protein
LADTPFDSIASNREESRAPEPLLALDRTLGVQKSSQMEEISTEEKQILKPFIIFVV